MSLSYWVAITLMMLGLYVMITHPNLFKKLVGMTVFQTSIILFFLLRSPLPVRCPGCQASAAPGAHYCPRCARPLVRSCPSCREAVGADDVYCTRCGNALAA